MLGLLAAGSAYAFGGQVTTSCSCPVTDPAGWGCAAACSGRLHPNMIKPIAATRMSSPLAKRMERAGEP